MQSDKLLQDLEKWKLPVPIRKVASNSIGRPQELVGLIKSTADARFHETKRDIRDVDGALHVEKNQISFYFNGRHTGNFWLYDSYEIVGFGISEHEYGSGGKNNGCVFLTRDGKPLIGSVHEQTYSTYSDDSEDHPLGETREIYVFDTTDPLARKIAERLGV